MHCGKIYKTSIRHGSRPSHPSDDQPNASSAHIRERFGVAAHIVRSSARGGRRAQRLRPTGTARHRPLPLAHRRPRAAQRRGRHRQLRHRAHARRVARGRPAPRRTDRAESRADAAGACARAPRNCATSTKRAVVEIADDTDAAVASGTWLSAAALIERFSRRRRTDSAPRRGSSSPAAAPSGSRRCSMRPHDIEPDLVLRGLARLAVG